MRDFSVKAMLGEGHSHMELPAQESARQGNARDLRVEAVIAGQLEQICFRCAALLLAQRVKAEDAGSLRSVHGCQLVPSNFTQHAQHHAS